MNRVIWCTILCVAWAGCADGTGPTVSKHQSAGGSPVGSDTAVAPPPLGPVSKNTPKAAAADPSWREVHLDSTLWNVQYVQSNLWGRPSIDTSAFRFGTSSQRFDLAPGECFGQDCLRTLYGVPHKMERKELSSLRTYQEGEEAWWGYSFYVPADKPTNQYWLTQIMTNNWVPLSNEDSETWGGWSPTVMFLHKEQSGVCASVFNQHAISCDDRTPTLVAVEEFAGKWHDVVVHLVASKTPSGLVDIWVDDVQKMHFQGATMYEQTTSGVYFKYGIYRQPNTVSITVFFDEVRLGKTRQEVDIRYLIANRK